MAKLLTLDGTIDFEDLPVTDYLRERPAAVLTMLDVAERYAREAGNREVLPETEMTQRRSGCCAH